MKKFGLLAICILMATGAFAQMSFNVKAGLNVNTHFDDSSSGAMVGFKVGGGMEYQFTDLISIQPSLLFTLKGTGDKTSVDNNNYVKATVNQYYLELPILVAFRFKVANNINIVPNIGPYFAVGIAGNSTAKTVVAGNSSKASVKTFGDNSNIKRFDMGLSLGANVEFGQIFAGIDMGFGFINLAKNIGNATNFSFGINAGYKF